MKLRIDAARVSDSFRAEHAGAGLDVARSLGAGIGRSPYSLPEQSLDLPSDPSLYAAVEDLYRAFSEDPLRLVVLIGIGGSNLGAKAIYDALYGARDALGISHAPRLVCLDTCDPAFFKQFSRTVESISNPREVVVFLASKSGSTTETIWNAAAVHDLLSRKQIGADRWIAVTDEGSPLSLEAQRLGAKTITAPKIVGGRYSVFSAFGLAPLRFLVGPQEELLSGAREMADRCRGQSLENPALQSALALLYHMQGGKTVHDTFFFSPELESVGRWYRQLLAESLGKEGRGIVPTVSIGSTDLHSVGQLYLGGLPTVYTCFVSAVPASAGSYRVPSGGPWSSLVPGVAGKSGEDIRHAILEGTKAAYVKREVPFIHAELPDVSLRSIGAFMQWKMAEVMILGALLTVNPFDQPAVELYKKETRAILGS